MKDIPVSFPNQTQTFNLFFVLHLIFRYILAAEAVSLLKQKGIAQMMNAPLDLIASDVLDHYRTYSLLERLLNSPTKLSEQPSFQLEPQSRAILIEK